MLTKSKSLYQVKLIIDCLPKDEYKLIPQETIDYLEKNLEYDEKIVIHPDIPLEDQNIDDKAYDMLEKIMKQVEENKKKLIKQQTEEYVKNIRGSNKEFDMKIENIELKKIIKKLEEENSKLPKAKKLVEEYQKVLKQKYNQIKELKEKNSYLYEYIDNIPKLIRKIFIKEEIKKY